MRRRQTNLPRRLPALRAWAGRAWTFFLVAWVALCCCEKRMFAESLGLAAETQADAVESADSPAPANCCSGCCASAGQRASTDTGTDSKSTPGDSAPEHRTCCSDGCCTKASCGPDHWTLDLDSVGEPLPPSALARSPRDEFAAQDARMLREPVPRPPPRQVRMRTARSNLAPPDAA